jgi:hypothetical protein
MAAAYLFMVVLGDFLALMVLEARLDVAVAVVAVAVVAVLIDVLPPIVPLIVSASLVALCASLSEHGAGCERAEDHKSYDPACSPGNVMSHGFSPSGRSTAPALLPSSR